MRENCTYGSMRGIRRKTAKHVLRVAEGRAGVPDNKGRPALLYTPQSREKGIFSQTSEEGCGFFLLNPRSVFTQATSSRAEARSPRFVRGRLRRATRLPFESCAFFGAFSTRVFGLRIGFQKANQ